MATTIGAVGKLKGEILQAFDRIPPKHRVPEGEGHTVTFGLNPRDLTRLFKLLLPHHKFSTITVRDSAGKGLHRDVKNSHYPQAIVAQGGALWIESATGTITKDYMGGIVYGVVATLPQVPPLCSVGRGFYIVRRSGQGVGWLLLLLLSWGQYPSLVSYITCWEHLGSSLLTVLRSTSIPDNLWVLVN